ncbi:preprotein translocase subunit SecD [Halopolyspora algeriensis]|uniref:Protein translocase subunit SecD n=1 Tax=Halopolyspora algeriensis TaxID=1500506 RepID=A0A368VUY9_9ACTN|nr:protein translocase subunit SecD [Halopolyspora algeriensis]RCW43906.1 preprotein translocase subunit SecD [Halopolyspora algeriensis]TQM53591.1 preprotein translocase subunit SecD [Halopolyspora algeriensis]
MAPPAGQIRPGRYLAAFALILLGIYALVFFTGDRKPTPELGIDLQGGTRVTLTARTPSGQPPSQQSLQQARQIIEQRVNGLGVSGSEVTIDGQNLIITVPGQNGEQAKRLGQTAELNFRKVVQVVPAGSAPPGQGQAPPGQGQAPAPGAGPSNTAPQSSGADGAPAQQPPSGEPDPDSQAAAIEQAKKLRQSTKPQVQMQALQALDCSAPDPLRGNADPEKPLVTCNQDGTKKYVLGPVFLEGEQVQTANAVPPNQQYTGWTVNLQFKSQGAQKWADFTSANVGKQAAFVLDTQVVSAPQIQDALLGGQATISGDFTQQSATNLANTLKYGSLPLAFDQSTAETVSPTLGIASMEAALLAGGLGLLLVAVYCLIYYRVLGLLTILSLVLSGAVVYGVLVLFGRWIGFTLDLPGMAGFIIAIGITADSFIVFFERLKDEIREGRTFRSAVPRSWARARRTILSADAVSFLAAAVLYILAVGQVKGFAFTLGMSTVLDLIVVFLVTHPLVALASRSRLLANPALSGLGAVQRMGEQARAARKRVSRKDSSATPKEA